jgi:hypothetical protein
MMVDEDLHGDLDPEVDPRRLSAVLERYR